MVMKPREVAEEGVGLAEELDEDAREPIDQREDARRAAGMLQRAIAVGGDAHGEEQHQPLEQRLVELARMAGQLGLVSGKTKAQGTSVGLPHNSPLMKLASRPRPRPTGTEAAPRSSMRSRLVPMRRPIEDAGHHHAEEAAVEGHAAIPHPEDLEGVGEVEERLVEQHVAEPARRARRPAPTRGRNHRPAEPSWTGLTAAPEPRRRDQPLHVPGGEEQPHDIGQRIPAHGEGPDLEQDGIDVAGRAGRRGVEGLGKSSLRTLVARAAASSPGKAAGRRGHGAS